MSSGRTSFHAQLKRPRSGEFRFDFNHPTAVGIVLYRSRRITTHLFLFTMCSWLTHILAKAFNLSTVYVCTWRSKANRRCDCIDFNQTNVINRTSGKGRQRVKHKPWVRFEVSPRVRYSVGVRSGNTPTSIQTQWRRAYCRRFNEKKKDTT